MSERVYHIIGRILGVILVIFMAGLLVIQFPPVQSWLSRKALERLDTLLAGKFTAGEVSISPSGSILVKDFLILDDVPYTDIDTLLRIERLSATVSIRSLFGSHGVHINRLDVQGLDFHLVTEPDSIRKITNNLNRVLGTPPPPEEPLGGPEIFTVRKVRFHDTRFRLTSYIRDSSLYSGAGINYDRLDVRSNEIRCHSVRMAGRIMYGICDHLDAVEKSGYVLDHLEARCRVGMGKAVIEDIHILDPWSDISLSSYCKTFRNAYSFMKYISDVHMEAFFLPSTLSMRSLMYFTGGGFQGNRGVYAIREGHLKGFVNDAQVENLIFIEKSSGVSGRIDAKFSGLPDIRKLNTNARVSNFCFTSSQLSRFLATWGLGTDFSNYATGVRFTFDGKAAGPSNRLKLNGRLNSRIGSLKAEADVIDLLSGDGDPDFKGSFISNSLNLGIISGSPLLGKLDASGSFRGKLCQEPEISVDSLRINSFTANGYDFSNIFCSASLSGNSVKAGLKSNDPNLKLNLKTSFDLKAHNGVSRYKLKGELSKADLGKLMIDRRPNPSSVAFDIYSDITEVDDCYFGEFSLSDIHLSNSDGTSDLGQLSIIAQPEGNLQYLKLSSSFVDADMRVDGIIENLLPDLKNISVNREIPALLGAGNSLGKSSGTYDLDVRFHNSIDLLSYIVPGLYIADNTDFRLLVNDRSELTATLQSPRLAFGTSFIKNARLDADNLDGSLNAYMQGDNLQLNNFLLQSPALSFFAKNNGATLGFNYTGISGTDNTGNVCINADLIRDSADSLIVSFTPVNSYFTAGDDSWKIDGSGITLRGRDVKVREFSILNGDQGLYLLGGISADKADTLALSLDNLNLDLIDEFADKEIGIKGTASGKAFLSSPVKGKLGMLMNMKIDSLNIGGRDAGNFRISSMWDDDSGSLTAYLRNNYDNRNALFAKCNIKPEGKGIDGSVRFDDFSVSPLAPFLSSVFSDMNGTLSGNVSIKGSVDKLNISGHDTRFSNLLTRVAYTDVPYVFDGPFTVNNEGINFDALNISDCENGTAVLSGSIKYNNLKDLNLNASLVCDNLLVFNSPEKGEESPYGRMSVNGSAKVSGPLSSLFLEGNLVTSGSGEIHIPLSGSLSNNKSDLLTFCQPVDDNVDPYELMLSNLNRNSPKGKGDMHTRATLTLDPGLKAYIEMDKASGNVISFGGDGSISVDIRPSKALFDLGGSYNIREGSYNFVLPGILSKEFEIQDGSSVTFGGNLMDSQIDIKAKHRIKASLNSLITDSTTVSSRRLVECGINISNRLSNPNLSFSINIPDLDPTTKSQVESALNTEDKIQKQFMALLLVGSFVPSETSGVFNGQSVLFSNVSEIMSNQLNSILQRLDIPLDFGFDYQGVQGGANIFDVAVSTQLFNNRVLVNGSFGNRKYKTTSKPTGEMVGNLDIEVKLDKPGRFRLSLFSHSADDYTNFLDNSQRNGLGFSYQKEFSFQRPKEGNVIIKINDEHRKTPSDTLSIGR